MRVAAAAYPLSQVPDWATYARKITAWVSDAASMGADLLVFPEYAGLELAALGPAGRAATEEGALMEAAAHVSRADALHTELAARHGVHILAGSAPVLDPAIGPRPVNRARFFAPSGAMGFQDKQIMTRFERDPWGVVPGHGLRLFDTELGPVGVLICYDAEFPLLARALVEAGAEILLVPSCTETEAGYWRVRLGAMARALEGQCAVVHAPLVGPAAWCAGVEENTGAAAVYTPSDRGFPADGVLALGGMDTPGWTIAEIDRAALGRLRRDGTVLGYAHWVEQSERLALAVERVRL